jgi:hypothetical protein
MLLKIFAKIDPTRQVNVFKMVQLLVAASGGAAASA